MSLSYCLLSFQITRVCLFISKYLPKSSYSSFILGVMDIASSKIFMNRLHELKELLNSFYDEESLQLTSLPVIISQSE